VTGPLTDQEAVWLTLADRFVSRRLEAMGGPGTEGQVLTSDFAREEARRAQQCTPGLIALGKPPSQRLQQVHTVLQSACGLFDQAARCYLTFAGIDQATVGNEARRAAEAISCAAGADSGAATKLVDANSKIIALQLQ
jgi:hypothetical protein